MKKFPIGFFEKERPTMEEYLEDIQLKYDTLNKGIDELIKKYEDNKKQALENINLCGWSLSKYHRNSAYLEVYEEIIQDLKEIKKGE